MGFHWKPVFVPASHAHGDVAACPDCGHVITDLDGEPINPVELEAEESRRKCSHCAAPLWTLIRPGPVRQRPVLDRAQGTEAHPTIGKSPRRS